MSSASEHDSSKQHPPESSPPITKVFRVTSAHTEVQPISEVPQDLALLVELPYHDARKQAIADFERLYIRSLLDRCGGNVSQSARVAGVDRVYLHRLLRKHGLQGSRSRPPRTRSEQAPKIAEPVELAVNVRG